MKKNYEIFIELFEYWSEKLKLGQFPITKDNRFHSHLVTEFYGGDHIIVKYNTRMLSTWNLSLILSGVFHELGHIKYDSPYETFDEKVDSEYEAEKYSVEQMKKHYPEKFHEVTSYYKHKLQCLGFKKEYPVHWEAFNKIEEYH